jgi:hypothetical protein
MQRTFFKRGFQQDILHLHILALNTSAQTTVFEMLKVSVLLCSRYGTAIERARRYFVLAEAGDELTAENKSEELMKQLTPAVVGGSSPVTRADGGFI